jgi:putative isomerase
MNASRKLNSVCAMAAASALFTLSAGLAAQASHAAAPAGDYAAVQHRLARGWNTWDTNSMMTEVLLPEGLAIHAGLKNNTGEFGDRFLRDAFVGQFNKADARVTPGPHSWDGSYTSLDIEWAGHKWQIESAHSGSDEVILATPEKTSQEPNLPPTIVFWVDFLWNRRGTTERLADSIQTHGTAGAIGIYCSCESAASANSQANPTAASSEAAPVHDLPIGGPYFSAPLISPVGISTGRRRSVAEIQSAIDTQRAAYEKSTQAAGNNAPIVDAIETTLGWDTIYDPSKSRVISPVSRSWSVGWGGWVLFDWDTFFASTLASIGDKDLAYANAMEILNEETPQGLVPNYARDGFKSYDRSEPPVGAVTVLGLYDKFHDRWFLADTFEPLMRWNRWWAEHRDMDGYLAWGSNDDTQPQNPDDGGSGTRGGAILESGLDNSPMYDSATYDHSTHLLEFADVGLMSMYVADCDALARIADALGKTDEAKELREREARYKAKLQTMWDEKTGMFLNLDLKTQQSSPRLSPTNFYPLLAGAATPEQAQIMIAKHLRNPDEFWGQWVIPSIARNDPAYADQNYWRGRIWGPMNFLVYLGLRNYDKAAARDVAAKSYELFLKEWTANRHVHENYNASTGSGDDVTSSDRFYHWGALLGYVEYMERQGTGNRGQANSR